MTRIQAGYVAFNGYVFTQANADTYNAECERCEAFPSEFNLNCRHRTFCIIIGLYDNPDPKIRAHTRNMD